MATFQISFYSKVLEKDVGMNVILPNHRDLPKKHKVKMLTVLHGKEARYTKWMNRVPLELYVRDYKMGVIMPDGEDSFYTNMYYGNQYWTYLSEEMLRFVQKTFPIISDTREDNFIMGSSMGGYGALKMAFNRPDLYSAAASLSGGFDLPNLFDLSGYHNIGNYIFGSLERMIDGNENLFNNIEKMAKKKKILPRIYMCCGMEDFVYGGNQKIKQVLEKNKIDFTYDEWHGVHDWKFWNRAFLEVIKWLGVTKVENISSDEPTGNRKKQVLEEV